MDDGIRHLSAEQRAGIQTTVIQLSPVNFKRCKMALFSSAGEINFAPAVFVSKQRQPKLQAGVSYNIPQLIEKQNRT
jgi:hypothetical protein